MDKQTVTRLDSMVEDDVRRGFRIREVPKDVRQAVADEGVQMAPKIRLTSVTPRRRRDINEVVQQRYHRDLANADILSDAEILKHAERRGEWNADKKRRMEELQALTAREMALVWAEGLDPDADDPYGPQIVLQSLTFLEAVDATDWTEEAKALVKTVFNRWLAFDPKRQAEFDQTHGPAQGRERYSAEYDEQWLYEHLPTENGGLMIQELDRLKDKQRKFLALKSDRFELFELQLKHARLFAGSAESRQQQCEELAQLYFTCEACDEAGSPIGTIAPSFDELWRYPDAAIRWLVLESYFFHNNVPDEARRYMKAVGFREAEEKPESGASAPSADSHEAPNSKTDTAPAAAMASASLEQPAATT